LKRETVGGMKRKKKKGREEKNRGSGKEMKIFNRNLPNLEQNGVQRKISQEKSEKKQGGHGREKK